MTTETNTKTTPTASPAKTAAPKTTTAPKPTSAKQAEAKAARDAAKQATSDQVLAWLTDPKQVGTFYSVREVETGTGNGPETDNVKTLRPTLWALVEKGLVQAGPTAAGRKGFAVIKPTAAAPAKKAPARKTA